MKRKTILTMLFATFILTANAQEKVSQQEKVCEEPIPFIKDGHIYLPLTIDGTHRANMIFDTGASGQLLVDTVYLKEQGWTMVRTGIRALKYRRKGTRWNTERHRKLSLT